MDDDVDLVGDYDPSDTQWRRSLIETLAISPGVIDVLSEGGHDGVKIALQALAVEVARLGMDVMGEGQPAAETLRRVDEFLSEPEPS